MAKNSIRDFSATAGSNTDIQSVNIDENCPASGINNAIRELMVDLKNVSTGAVNLETPAADSLTVAGDLTVDTNTLKVDGSNNRVGIGTALPGHLLHLKSSNPTMRMEDSDGASNVYGLIQADGAGSITIAADDGNNSGSTKIAFLVDGTERMRIDSSGNLIIGVANLLAGGSAYFNEGINIKPGSDTIFHRDGGSVVDFSRGNSDGEIVRFIKDNSVIGHLKVVASDNLAIDCTSTNHSGLEFSTNELVPRRDGAQSDNTINVGAATVRFDNIYATNGTIQTSDQNEKQDIAILTSAEITAAKAISKLFKTFKWKSKVAAKGDAARTHTGVIAQEVQQAMTAAGLDATKYAFWCSDTWWETSTEVAAVEAVEGVRDDDGNLTSPPVEARDAYTRIDTYQTAEEAPEGATQRTRLGIRYPELLSFIGAATEQRLADIETRLTALEA